MQLHPRESFTITRQLNNPYITDTFYVRAVIRNAKTDTIISTINLTDKTGQRFSKTWQVPADPSGQGFWISIITSVYTDSGYTAKSDNYGDEENTYLVQERYVFNPNYPVGPDIDYKRIKKMIDDAIKNIAIPEQKVITVTKEVVKEVPVPQVKIVETQTTQDLSPILKAIKNVGQQVADKEVTEIPEMKEVDMQPIMDRISEIDKKIDDGLDKMSKKVENLKVKVEISNPMVEAKVQSEPIMDPRISRIMRMK